MTVENERHTCTICFARLDPESSAFHYRWHRELDAYIAGLSTRLP